MSGYTDNDKKQSLLDALTIDDADKNLGGKSSKTKYIIGFIAISIVAVYLLFSNDSSVAKPNASVTTSATKTQLKVAATTNTADNDIANSKTIAGDNSRANIVLSASGYVIARRIATVSAEITARIMQVLIEEGMLVTKNQVLARLEDTVYKINLRRADANLKLQQSQQQSVQARIAEAERVLTRERSLRKDGYSSEARITSNETQVAILNAELQSILAAIKIAQLEISNAKDQLANTVITAPFAGVIINKAAQQGEIVSPVSAGGGFTRTGIGTIVDMNSLEIEVDVSESFIGRVYVKQPVIAALDAYPDWQIPAQVLAVVPTANRSKATVRVRIAILEIADKKLKSRILPDMAIKVDFYK